MLVKIGLVYTFGDAVEVGKQAELRLKRFLSGLALFQEVFNECLGMYLFLNVKRRSPYGQRIIAVIFASPDELGIKVRIPFFIADAHRRLFFLLHYRLILRCRDIGTPGFMGNGFNLFRICRFLSH